MNGNGQMFVRLDVNIEPFMRAMREFERVVAETGFSIATLGAAITEAEKRRRAESALWTKYRAKTRRRNRRRK